MTHEQLQEIVASHGRWLTGDGGIKANLYGANLRDADLYGANLRGANLRDADLYGANLRGANLYGANLYGANLRDADLCDADLCDANLRGADLCDANLRGANLYGANLPIKIVQVGPIGSRRGYTIYNVTQDIVQCGCWLAYKGGSLDMFERRVNDTYSADNIHGDEYRRLIAWFKAERAALLNEQSNAK